MLRHAVTGVVIVAISLAITLFFTSRSQTAPQRPQVDLRASLMTFKSCDESLMALNSAIADALADTAHRNERLAKVMGPVEHECTLAESSIRDLLARNPDDKRLQKMRDRNALGQQWLRDLSTAIAAYEVAAKTGSASPELAKLQDLLQ